MKEPYFKDVEGIRSSWGEWLDNFIIEIYPTFKERGLNLNTAILIYRFNSLANDLVSHDDNEDWKNG